MIVFSHGFGVDKDSRGLFSDIAAIFGPDNCIQFDYNDIDTGSKTITVAPLDRQAEKLRQVLSGIDEPVNLICHSQGCLVAALAMPIGLQSILFLAPASTTTSNDFKELFGNRLALGGVGEPDILKRKDGTTTLVKQEYWDSLDTVGNAHELYAKLAGNTFLTVITAEGDELVGKKFPMLENRAEVHTMTGADHNFTGDSRKKLLEIFSNLDKTLKS